MRTALVIAVLSAAMGFGAAWKLQGHQLTKQELNHANERIAIARANRAALERNQNAVLAAQNAATVRAVAMRRDVDAARAAAVGLRQSSDAAVRAAAESTEACHRVVNAYSVVFTESTGFIQEVVGDVGRCGSAFQTLDDAWPKSNVK